MHSPPGLLLCLCLCDLALLLRLVCKLLFQRNLLLLRLSLHRVPRLLHTLLVLPVLVIGAEDEVEVTEAGGVVVDEGHVVEVVVVSAGPEGEPVLEGPGEVVAGVGVDGLEEAEGDPDVDGEDVEVLGDVAVEEGTADGARAEDEDLERVGVLCCETEGGGVLVVDLVDVLVERTEMEGLVGEVVKKSSKTKKRRTCAAISFKGGKGTCHVERPKNSASGWKR